MNRTEIPEKIYAAAQQARQRRAEFLGERQSFTALFITDVHTGGNERYRQLAYVGDLIPMLGVDFVVNGGDIGLDLGEDEATSEQVLALTEKYFAYPVPHFLCKGNHDYGTQKVPAARLNRMMNGDLAEHYADRAEVISDEEGGGMYGRYYDETTKTHLLFLNTSEGNTRSYVMSPDQLSYVAAKLSAVGEGENVMLFSHYCPRPCGEWRAYPQDTSLPWLCALTAMEGDFVARRTGGSAELGLVWDFTAVPVSARLICHMCGDSHFFAVDHTDGVLTLVRQGYGGVEYEDLAPGATKDFFDKDAECSFDLLVVREDQAARLFHVGAGGAARDCAL